MADAKLVTVTVAPGRCMIEPVPNGVLTNKIFHGKDSAGQAIVEERVVSSAQRRVLPGKTLKVADTAVADLVATGFIVDPSAPAATA
jgi:hypothetical protein